MAIFLFKLIRRKLGEREAQNAVLPTTDDSLVTEYELKSTSHSHQHGLSEDPTRSHINLPEDSTGSHINLPEDSTGSHINLSEDFTGSRINLLTSQEAAQQKAETRRRNIRQLKLLLGLALPNFLAALDVTIVAPAIPLISSHFNRLSGSFNWIVAAYTLTFCTFVPASGQLAEIYGRHFALQFEMCWIMIGSVLCAAARSWPMLLGGRALQGLGAAGIMSLSRIILSDGATLAETSRSNSILSFLVGSSYAVGPIIGGYLADAGWRYVFVLPIAVAVLAMLIIFFAMRKELVRGHAVGKVGESRRLGYISGLAIIDWPGLFLFILGVGLIILAVQWGGTQYAWNSAAVVAPFVLGGIMCVAFFAYEYSLGPGRAVARMFPRQVPMIPSTLFRKKDTALLMTINFSAGTSMVAAFYFISYYWQLAEGYSSSQAGVQLLYYTPGLGLGVCTAMTLCNRWPRQTYSPLLIGSIVEVVGLALLTYSVSTRNPTMVKVFLGVTGAGTGLRFMPVVLHAAGLWSTRIPAMQSLLSFMLPLGQTVGISMMGSVFANKLSKFLARINTQHTGVSLPTSGPPSLDLINSLSAVAKEQVQNAAAKAVMWALISILPFVGLSIFASVFLGNVWIGKAGKEGKDGKAGRKAEKGKVMYGMYLYALVTGDVAVKKEELDVNMNHEGIKKQNGALPVFSIPSGASSGTLGVSTASNLPSISSTTGLAPAILSKDGSDVVSPQKTYTADDGQV